MNIKEIQSNSVDKEVGNKSVTSTVPPKKPKSRNMTNLLLGGLAVGIAIIVLVIWSIVFGADRTGSICGKAIKKNAQSIIKDDKQNELKTIVEDITQDYAYTEDVNCVYIAGHYYLASEQSDYAINESQRLKEFYDNNILIDSIFGDPNVEATALIAAISQQQAIKKGNYYIIEGDTVDVVQ